jgi:hypothetical protein
MVVAWWLVALWALLVVRAGRVPQWMSSVLVPTDGTQPVPQDKDCTCSELPKKYVRRRRREEVRMD